MHTSTKIGAIALVVAAIAFASLRCPYLNGKSSENLGKSASNIKWSYCDGLGSKYFTISNVQIVGTFLDKTNVDFILSGTVNQGYSHYFTDTTIKLGFINVFSGVSEENPPKTYTPGPLNAKSTSTLTQDAPNGSYTMTLRFLDAKKSKFECLEVTYKLA